MQAEIESILTGMKTFHLASVLALVVALSGSKAEDAPNEASISADKLAVLQRERDERTAAALAPIREWFNEQLAKLKEQSPSATPHVQEPLAHVSAKERSKYWTENQPELKAALVTNGWLWRSEDDSTGVPVTFNENGTATHIGMQGVWSITGPSEVTIHTTEQERFVLRFNSSLTCYEADCRGVEGQRLAAEK